MSNRLSNQSSPYLLQHADNPVDWYPWCEEAFERAKNEDKPVFLSIGYSTCHWCHVMAHESFEDAAIAKLLNENFISIKVDREERPDIDSVYMAVCHAFTGSGGWPMSIFMTAEQKPFFAGTYFPPHSRQGMLGFYDLLLTVVERWRDNKQALFDTANMISTQLSYQIQALKAVTDETLPDRAMELFLDSFDSRYGGFGSAPKFPAAHNLIFLTLYSLLKKNKKAFDMVEKTLEVMRRGGIFDQIGYGFSRYSTDRYFLVPHFEKMLYDNALLIIAYSVVYHASENALFLETAKKTAEYLFHEMRGTNGAFYSAQDADSDGEEGKYYVWSRQEIEDILGKESSRHFCEYYGVTENGNFEGKNILNLLNGNEITDVFENERQRLYQHRKQRGKLHLDDKVLAAWNSLMVCALVTLYRVSGEESYLQAARETETFISQNLKEGEVLYVSWRKQKGQVKGFLTEYAYYAAAQLFLYDATAEQKYLEGAISTCKEAWKQFADEEGYGYFLSGGENVKLIARMKEAYDGAMPSGNSVMAYCLVRLFQITGQEKYQKRLNAQFDYLSGEAVDYPAGYSMFLVAMLLKQYPGKKITIVLAKEDKAKEVIRRLPLQAQIQVLAGETPEYKLLNGKTTYYVCEGYTCLPPANQLPTVSAIKD